MNFLFFDIECANCENHAGKIYSFGYLVADDNLNIIEEQRDLLINPNAKWDWYVLRKMLAYPRKIVEASPIFSKHYDGLKSLLENKDTIVCGFSVRDDVGYLLDECKRYELKPFKFNFFDIQRLDAKVSGSKKRGLSAAYEFWCDQVAEDAHRSDVDARCTYEVAKTICEKQKRTLLSFVEELTVYSGTTDGFRYGFNDEQLLSREERHERKMARIEKEGCEDFILKGRKNHLLFVRFVDSVSPKANREKIFEGKKISLSLNYESYHFRNMMKLVQIICNCGRTYVTKATDADIFVKYHLVEDGEERRCTKSEYVMEAIGNGAQIQVLEFEEFLNLLGLNEESLESIPEDNYDYLLDEKYSKKTV